MAETQVGSSINAKQQGTKGPVPVRITLDRDIEQRANLSKEFFRRHYPDVVYRALNRPGPAGLGTSTGTSTDPTSDKTDPLYVEERSKTFAPAILVPCQVNADPPRQLQKKFGLDEEREVVFIFSTFILQELGIQMLPGDKIVYDGHDYEIQSTHRRDYWLNSGVPFHFSAESDRYREERT